jgi:hypothetical protein
MIEPSNHEYRNPDSAAIGSSTARHIYIPGLSVDGTFRKSKRVKVPEHLDNHLRSPVMVQLASVVALCSTLFGVSRAAGQGSAAEYADGTVHARIMGLKMVRTWRQMRRRTELINIQGTMGG